MDSTKTIINYYSGAPVPKYLSKIPKNVQLLSLIYCNKEDDKYEVDYNMFYFIDYSFLNDYKNMKSLFLYNWGDYPPKDNLIELLEKNLLHLSDSLEVISFCNFKQIKDLTFLKKLSKLKVLIINADFSKQNILKIPDNLEILKYTLDENYENIINYLPFKFKNLKIMLLYVDYKKNVKNDHNYELLEKKLKKIFLEKNFEETPTSKIKFDELVNKLKLKNIEIVSNYDNFDLREFIIDLFENDTQEVNVIDLEKDDE